MKQKSIKIYIIPFIAIATFSLLLFGAGYAYFTSSISMNTANYAINMPSITSLICTKTDCNTTITPAMMTNTNTSATTPKGTSNCSVTCTCSGSPGATCNYNVLLFENGYTYVPSSSLGSGKEFTVNVTSSSGCTSQNSSNAETQLSAIKDKVVSSCALTVPASGSVSANVSAEFKWYNLDLDQTAHVNQLYGYQLMAYNGNDYTGVIYRNNSDELYFGSSIISKTGWCGVYNIEGEKYNTCTNYNIIYSTEQECLSNLPEEDESTYGTSCIEGTTRNIQHSVNSNTLSNSYLKHHVVNGIIVSSYACFKFSGKEYCLKAGDDAYGSYTGISSTQVNDVSSLNPTGNIGLLQRIFNDNSSTFDEGCKFNNQSSYCSGNDGYYYLDISRFGNASVMVEGYSCYVGQNGYSACM